MEVKENMKRAEDQIKRLATLKEAPVDSDRNESVRVPRKKRESTGVILSRKQQEGKMTKHHGAQRYCVIFKKSGMPDQNYMSHISQNCFGKRYYQQPIKEGIL